MNAKSPGSISELTVCPSCGAAVANSVKACWLCKWEFLEEIVTAEVVGEPPDYVQKSTSTSIALILAIVTFGVVTVGVFAATPVTGIAMAVVWGIASIAVAKSIRSEGPSVAAPSAIEQAYASPATRAAASRGSDASGALNVIGTVFKVLGIVVLIIIGAIAAFIAFCVICLFIMCS